MLYTFKKAINIAGSGIIFNNNIIEELELIITFNVFGKNIPATWENPPEYAEIDIQTIMIEIQKEIISNETTQRIINELTHIIPTLEATIETYCWEYLEDITEDL